jgi:alcohol dehydrogenase
VSGNTIPTLLKLARDGRIEAEKLGTHRFSLGDIQEAYNVFGAAGEHDALKVVIQA